jgi:hypothetical protein
MQFGGTLRLSAAECVKHLYAGMRTSLAVSARYLPPAPNTKLDGRFDASGYEPSYIGRGEHVGHVDRPYA